MATPVTFAAVEGGTGSEVSLISVGLRVTKELGIILVFLLSASIGRQRWHVSWDG